MTRQLRPPVLVGIDGSKPSLAALDFAAVEAFRRGLPLRLVHGYTWPVSAQTFGIYIPVDQGDEPDEDAQHILDAAADDVRLRHPDLEVTTDVVAGPAARVLVDESASASMLVVGSHGRGGFTGLLLGSVGTQVVAHARCPVVVVRSGAGTDTAASTRPVVVGVDGSDLSERAVAFAFEEASLRATSLTAVAVWDGTHVGRGPVPPRDHDFDQAKEEASLSLAEALAGYQDKYPDVSVHRAVVRSLNPAAVLVEASREAGLIVVGARGRGGFTGLLLGSVSQALLHHAHCPVAVLRHHPAG